MTLKELQKHYKVFKHDKVYHIHSSTVGGRYVYKYLCSAQKKGKSFNVIGYKGTTLIEKFKNQVEDYLSKLEYDSEYFHPLYKEGIKEVHFVHDYLTNLGFKSFSSSYVYNSKNIFGGKTTEIALSFYGLDVWRNFNSKEVKISLSTGRYSWTSITVKRTFKDIQEGIDSVIKPLLLSESAVNLTLADKLETVIKDYKDNSMIDYTILSTDYKKQLKEKLLEIAEKL